MILAALYYHTVLGFFFAVVAVVLILVILLQRGKGVGLAGAFGGTGGHTAFGAKTGDFLTWVTVVGAGILLIFAVLLNYVFVPTKVELGPRTGTPPAGTQPTEEKPGGAWHLEDPASWPDYASTAIFGETAA